MTANEGVVSVMNKIDLAPAIAGGDLRVSALTGAGLEALVARLAERAEAALGAGESGGAVTRARHRAELAGAMAALERFRSEAEAPELKAEELRAAAHHLGRLTGRIGVEEVLGAIFAEFCIGK
jgi:tRNA modification GTPase